MVVSLHDVHPGSFPLIRDQVAFCTELGIARFSHLLVPDYHRRSPFTSDPDLVAFLRQRQDAGDEIVLHGYFHLRVDQPDSISQLFWTRLYTANEAEFLDLAPEAAAQRIDAGRALLRAASFEPAGFIAPAWLMAPHLPRLLFDRGFLYTNTVDRLLLPHTDIPARSLCYSARAAWRRLASQAWNAALFASLRSAPLLRLSLHPRDLTFPPIRDQIARIVSQALAMGYIPTTYRALAKKISQGVGREMGHPAHRSG